MNFDIYSDIAARCGGDIYVGVVGPARTGKSTLVNKFMTELVIPNAVGEWDKTELCKTASGSSVVTFEPTFLPSKAVKMRLGDSEANVRLCDCVGFIADGATGYEEDGSQKLINTPWTSNPLPFGEAAELCVKKIADNSSICVCVTCDGSVADIPREGYVSAEERTVNELKTSGKPFVIVLNCAEPQSERAQKLKVELENKYGCSTLAINCERVDADTVTEIFRAALFEFAVTSFDVKIPDWMQVMPKDSSAICELLDRVKTVADKIARMKDCEQFDGMLKDCKFWDGETDVNIDLANGKAKITAKAKDGIFFDMLSEIAGESVKGERALMGYIASAAEAKKNYGKIKDAFECAKATGYGIVQPDDSDLHLENPSTVRKGANVGIKLRATAPSYHIMKIDITGEASPIMGSAAQSEEIVKGMMTGFENDPESMWKTDVFGKSLKGMVKDGLYGKTNNMSEDIKSKMRRAVTRMVNEGKGGVICIIL